MRLILSLIFCIIIALPGIAQNLSAKQLMAEWRISNITQTQHAEATYADLKWHKNKISYHQKKDSIEAYLAGHNDARLRIRTTIYEILAKKEFGEKLNATDSTQLQKAINTAKFLGDEQLTSELYTLYAEYKSTINGFEKRLLYNLKAIEIQERIGEQYFPLLFERYITTSLTLFYTTDYRQCIIYGVKALMLMKKSTTILNDYVLLYDALGSSYLMLNKPDSTIFYYNKISGLLKHPLPGNIIMPGGNSTAYYQLWSGIADGGKGRAYFVKKQYDIAQPLLQNNIYSSTGQGEYGDAALAMNTLSNIYFVKGKLDSALSGWMAAFHWSKSVDIKREMVAALEGVVKVYTAQKKYDSALVYNNLYHLYKDSLTAQLDRSRLAIVNAQLEFEDTQNNFQLAKIAVSRQILIRNISLGLIAFLVFLSIVYYKNQKKKQAQLATIRNLELSEKQNQLRMAQSQIDAFTKNIADKNKLIENLQAGVDEDTKAKMTQSLKHFTILTNEDWLEFKEAFEKVHYGYFERLNEKMPHLTLAETRFMVLTKLNLDNKEMALATGVSPQTIRVVMHRIRKKYGLSEKDDFYQLANSI